MYHSYTLRIIMYEFSLYSRFCMLLIMQYTTISVPSEFYAKLKKYTKKRDLIISTFVQDILNKEMDAKVNWEVP